MDHTRRPCVVLRGQIRMSASATWNAPPPRQRGVAYK